MRLKPRLKIWLRIGLCLMQIGVSGSANPSANPPTERMSITVVINKLHTIKNVFNR